MNFMKKALLVATITFAAGCSDEAEIARKAHEERLKCVEQYKLNNPPKKSSLSSVFLAMDGCYEPNPNAVVIAKCAEAIAEHKKWEQEWAESEAMRECDPLLSRSEKYTPMDKYKPDAPR